MEYELWGISSKCHISVDQYMIYEHLICFCFFLTLHCAKMLPVLISDVIIWYCKHTVFFFFFQIHQDLALMFGLETASSFLEKWNTSFKKNVIKKAKTLNPSAFLLQLLKSAEKNNGDNSNEGKST